MAFGGPGAFLTLGTNLLQSHEPFSSSSQGKKQGRGGAARLEGSCQSCGVSAWVRNMLGVGVSK